MSVLKIVHTTNVVKAKVGLEALINRGRGEEGMGLLYGRPGEGKTTTVCYLMNQYNGVFLRANVTWTVASLLRSLMLELGLEPHFRRAPMIDAAIESLSFEPRPIFIDEADYCLREMDMLDAIRDIYDSASIPVVLITMETAPRVIRTNQRLARFRRRITQWIEFNGLTMDDALKIADDLYHDVDIEEELVARVHAETSGNIGLMLIAFSSIRKFARTNELDSVSVSAFGKRGLLSPSSTVSVP